MGIFIAYILKSSFCLIIFYLLYKWMMANETFFRLNRTVILVFWLLAFLLPAINPSELQNTNLVMDITNSSIDMSNYAALVKNSDKIQTDHQSYIIYSLICVVYFIGLLIITIKQIIIWSQLFRLIRKGKHINYDSYCLVIVEGEQYPFSCMKYIIISEKDYKENHVEIIAHEKAHIQHKHSLELLIVDVLLLLQWFNPAAWLLKQEMQSVHEYEADNDVLSAGIDAKSYQLLLIKKAVGTSRYTMANSFNHSSLKKRITMMLKEKSNPWARAKYVMVLPLAALSVVAFAHPKVSKVSKTFSESKISELWTDPQEKTPDVKAKFPGDEKEAYRFMAKNIKYPALAQEAGVEGRVECLVTIGTDGSIKNVRITKPVNKYLDKEVIRIMNEMPKWEPAQIDGKAVESTIPFGVVFKFDGSNIQSESDTDIIVVGYGPK